MSFVKNQSSHPSSFSLRTCWPWQHGGSRLRTVWPVLLLLLHYHSFVSASSVILCFQTGRCVRYQALQAICTTRNCESRTRCQNCILQSSISAESHDKDMPDRQFQTVSDRWGPWMEFHNSERCAPQADHKDADMSSEYPKAFASLTYDSKDMECFSSKRWILEAGTPLISDRLFVDIFFSNRRAFKFSAKRCIVICSG